MKKLIIAAATIAAFSTAAFAGQMEGKVQSVDTSSRMIMLEDGSSYVAADGVAIEELAEGDSVVVTYDDGTNNATAVEKM